MEIELEAVIGANVARLRANRRIGQPEFGKRVGEFLGADQAWSRQSVSAMENGRRAFTARDLVVISHLLEVPVSALLYIGPEVDQVIVGKRRFSRQDLEASGWQTEGTTESIGDVLSALGGLSERLGNLVDDAFDLKEASDSLTAATHRMRHLQALEAKGATIEEDYR